MSVTLKIDNNNIARNILLKLVAHKLEDFQVMRSTRSNSNGDLLKVYEGWLKSSSLSLKTN